ncbi:MULTISPECIES: ECF transporter S component [Lacticaseibacillus]|uniref:Riboflavin transporter n=2 Tax=Lacticaseibacillus TaxID=2759736 RepID=A0ABW4CFW5_9LACO|nr:MULTISPECIES: ECF transporter S component [Lacticaseibacillus]
MSGQKLHRLVGIALLAAVGFVLQLFIAFPIIPAFPFLKLDPSDLAVLLGGFIYGPVAGIGVAFCRSLLHFLITGPNLINLVGDLAAFIASVGFMIPVVLAVRKGNSMWHQVGGLIGGTFSLTVIMSFLNWVAIMPMYLAVMNFQLGMSTTKYVLIGVVPFNLIKGAVISVLFFALAHAMMPWLEKQRALHPAR